MATDSTSASDDGSGSDTEPHADTGGGDDAPSEGDDATSSGEDATSSGDDVADDRAPLRTTLKPQSTDRATTKTTLTWNHRARPAAKSMQVTS